MIKNNLYLGFIYLLISLYSITDLYVTERQDRTGAAKYKTAAFYLARASPETRASPEDSIQYSIRKRGESNTVIINGQIRETVPDSIDQKNTIRVDGEWNAVTINQTDQKSEVIITQKGKNNQITISQRK